MSEIKIIDGEIFKDERGTISSLNNFVFGEIKRFYFIHHPDKSVVRGWHAHKYEKKWFYCVKGAFTIALVQPDNWENPSSNLEAQIFHLDEESSQIIEVPIAYANCIKAKCDGSILLVYSDKTIPQAYEDSYRYDKSLWVDWDKF